MAHAADDLQTIRRYYFNGTLYSTVALGAAAIVIWLVSPVLLRVWLGPGTGPTLAILPLVLVHTVAGGSSAVGRSILLAIGKVKAFAASVLIAGIANVVLSLMFVRYLHLGLRGIVYGTLCAVFGRCVIWMPWYVLRSIRSPSQPPSNAVTSPTALIPS
jgi:O-antigen/teichoic acid export membrane protein